MARKKDATSTRQLAFKMLDDMTTIPRKDAAEQLMEQFNIKRPYAMTIYQQHRTLQKKNGTCIPVFIVRDIKDNKHVTPFMSEVYKSIPEKDDAITQHDAILSYCENQTTKMESAKQLEPTDS